MQTMKTKKRITMSEVAAELGLSRMTVSSVLNNQADKRRISTETARRVLQHMEARGYVPLSHALKLRQGGREAVGILHSGDLYSHLTDAYNRMCSLFSKRPRRLELMVIPREAIIEGIKELISRSVSHLVWIQTAGSEKEFEKPAVKTYLSHAVPVIYNYLFPSRMETAELLEEGYFLIGADRKAGYGELAIFLKKLGHRKVVAPDGGTPSIREAFSEEGLEVYSPELYSRRNMTFEEIGRASAREGMLLLKKKKATALCYGDDAVAGFALSELAAMGVSVPRDVTVTGFDGLEFTKTFHPPLTTLRMPVREMVACVQGIISGRRKRKKNVFRMELMEGRSHARSKS